jgi:hypothetical protein
MAAHVSRCGIGWAMPEGTVSELWSNAKEL